MACRLAGVALPERAPASNKRDAAGEAGVDNRADAMNGPFSMNKKPRVDLNKSQPATARPRTSLPVERSAGARLNSDSVNKARLNNDLANKQARVEEAPEDEEETPSTQVECYTWRKRAASLEPDALREDADGRTKRAKLETATAKQSLSPVVTGKAGTAISLIASEHRARVPTELTCASCLDLHRKSDMLELPCKDQDTQGQHAYCRECLQRLFESSVTDPSHFPPRCCSKIISLSSCKPFLSQALVARFLMRQEELGTVNRTYCSNTTCSKWIRPANIRANEATCAECKQKTCAVCKGKQHTGLCPEDKDTKELMNVARRQRWQTCPSCKEMVELERGCYHITQVFHLQRTHYMLTQG